MNRLHIGYKSKLNGYKGETRKERKSEMSMLSVSAITTIEGIPVLSLRPLQSSTPNLPPSLNH